MAPKKRKKQNGGDDGELEQEALAEWLSRGLAASDFTMDKMLKLWMEEDDNGNDEDGGDALLDKQELIQSYNVFSPVLEHAKDVANDLKDSAIAEAKRLWVTAKHYAEIPALRRRRLLHDHVRDVRHMDGDATKYAGIQHRFATEFDAAANELGELAFGLKKRNRGRAPLLARFRELKIEADREQHARLRNEIEQTRRARMDAELLAKQRAREAQERAAADQLVVTRQLNATYWQKQLADARAFAEQQTHAQTMRAAFADQVARTQSEMHHMALAERDDAARDLARVGTTSSLGVFDTAYAPGEWHSTVDGGDCEELGEHTIAVTSARGYVAEHEVVRIELLEAQSRVLMLQQKLEQVAQVRAVLTQDRRTLFARKDATLAEIKHLADEHDALSYELAGPPRRDPSEADKRQFHTLVTRRATHMQQLAALDARLANVHKREQLVVRSEQVFGPQLTAARAREAQLQTRVDEFDAHRHDLPMIVGRSIFEGTANSSDGERQDGVGESAGHQMNSADDDDVATARDRDDAHVTEQHRDPIALLTHVTMQSKLELLKHAAEPVDKHYRAAKRLAVQSWQYNEHKVLAQHELEATKTRLADVRDRFVEQQRASLRADLMHAITRYHRGGNRLRKCIFPVRGVVDWWHQRAPLKSHNVSWSEHLGVMHLEAPHTRGQLKGCVRFPKRGRYRVQLTICLQQLEAPSIGTSASRSELDALSGGDAADADSDDMEQRTARQSVQDLKVYIGNDYDALQELTFHDPSGKVLHTGELVFEYFGNRLCYCFEFSLVSDLAWREPLQFTVCHAGAFEERIEDFRDEEQRVRQLQQRESHFVSELVKTIRLQSKQTSSERCTELLQELLDVERSRAKTWDSALLHGHAQRFRRVEYAKMLRGEIKKEVTRQIDQDVSARKARGVVDREDDSGRGAASTQTSSDISRLEFLSRKCALVEPQLLHAKDVLGDYCSFKAVAPEREQQQQRRVTAGLERKPAVAPVQSEASYRKESMIVGLRFEWREGKSKVHVMHKLCTALPTTESIALPSDPPPGPTIVDEWCQIETANTVYLASAFAKALQTHRCETAKARALESKKDTQLRELQRETQQTQQDELDAEARERSEDVVLRKLKTQDLARRKRKLHSDAIRLTTYNERISAQIDFQVQRRLNALAQSNGEDEDASEPSAVTTSSPPPAAAADRVVRDVKERFATQFVEGRLALAAKTWERKEKRLAEQRDHERCERAFRIRQEATRAAEITSESTRELEQLQHEHDARAKQQLMIANFGIAVQGQFACEHRDVKNWGTKYDVGVRCKQCGKEMAKSFDEPHAARGADPELDMDVQVARGHDAGGPALRFQSSAHLARVESERVRLEKEARAIQLADAVLYDRMNPKVIDAFNFRHGLDRGVAVDVDGADPLYPRIVHDAHRAAFQDSVLFHGRLRNFVFRIAQLNDLHAHTTTLLAVQRDFLVSVDIENAFVMEQLPLVERDHARTVQLMDEDAAALQQLESAKQVLTAAQREREAASHAIEGVEEEAEFAEFHVPALVKSSIEMQAIVTRVTNAHSAVAHEISLCNKRLIAARDARAKTDGLLERLNYRTSGTLVRTQFGIARVQYYREDDSVAVLSLLSWSATLFVCVDKLMAYEALFREDECAAMASEERAQHAFDSAERCLERRECELMAIEDVLIDMITAWWRKQQQDDAIVRSALEREELAQQLQYELSGRKQSLDAAASEAKRLHVVARVSLKRRKKAAVHILPSRLDILRVTRACEKRLAMAAVEAALTGIDTGLRDRFTRERDAIFADVFATQVLDEIRSELTREICAEAQQDALIASRALTESLNSAIVPHDDAWHVVCTHTQLGFDRLWIVRRAKFELLQRTWQREASKLDILRRELARRAELARLAEQERVWLETQRREMLAEERRCRQFYVDEMVLYMQERKAMAHAELEMREYMRQLELEAMKTKYAKMVEDRNHTSDKAARRLEIKLGKNEKHRLHREWDHIKREDDHATQLRERELAQAQAEALERQFDRYLIQQAINGKVAAALEASRLQERVREAQRLAAERRAALEATLMQERMVATVTAFHAVASAEVMWMHAVERASYWLQQLAPLAANLRALTPELERVVHEREHVVADAQRKREHARTCQARLQLATAALEAASKVKDACAKQYTRIHYMNATVDSDVLHGRPQRFRTAYLREQLHTRYFRLLTESIVRRAIVDASEREVVRLEDKLRALHDERVVKSKEVGRLKCKHRRAFHMSLRRAELGKLLFGGSQRRVVRERFAQWVKLWSQRVSVRASFELKHSLILQQQRLRAAPTLSSTLSTASRLENDTSAVATKLSVLHDHQKRLQVCRLCKREYSEERNNRYACAYHPEPYEVACVRTCASRRVTANSSSGGNGTATTSAVAASCMLHRTRRWLCCDETDEGRFSSNGCARRYHMPTRANPALEKLVAKKTQAETALVEQLDQQLLELRERNVVGHVKSATKAVITKIERELADKRAVAAKYHTLDRR